MYDYIIEKPDLDEDLLMHYGVLGMKWRKKASKKLKSSKKSKAARKEFKDMVDKAYAKKSNAMLGESRFQPSEKNLNAMYKDKRYAGKNGKYKGYKKK